MQSHRNVGALLGHVTISLCDRSFALHNRLASKLTGRSIETISTKEIQEQQICHDPLGIVLVDVRSQAEQAVSVIPGAITAQQYEAGTDRYAGKTVVPYCTVGGRSYLYARKLAAAGIPTKNYRDSILGWCRARLPLQTIEGESTSEVHPYWSILPFPDCYLVVHRQESKQRR